MIKVFMSQRTNQKTEEQINDERSRAFTHLKNYIGSNFTIIDSFIKEDSKDYCVNELVYFLGRSLELISNADVAVFLPGWEFDRGCRIEHEVCMEYGIETHYVI